MLHKKVDIERPRGWDWRFADISGILRGFGVACALLLASICANPLLALDFGSLEDPSQVFGTYYGDSDQEFVNNMATDRDGNIYLVGQTSSSNFPTTAGVLQETYGGGGSDGFLMKLAPNGSLVYATLLGGSLDDRAFDVDVDSAGQAFVVGATSSDDFPGLANGLQVAPDAFIVKVSAGGDLVLFTYVFGGESGDDATTVVVDALGRAHLGGITSSSDFPVTAGVFQDTLTAFSDGFAARLNATGDALEMATFIGGTANEELWGLDLDSAGNLYLAGFSTSSDFPTLNPLQPSNGGLSDGFVAKLLADGSALEFSTYFGGDSKDEITSIQVGATGEILVVGGTQSSDFPTQSPKQNQILGSSDAFLARFSNDGQTLIFSALLGGTASDWAVDCALDTEGRAYLTGYTSSDDFPLELALFDVYGGAEDAFVSCFSADGDTLLFSTYLGGNNFDQGTCLGLASSGRLAVGGQTMSTDFPVADAWQNLNGGLFDAFVVGIAFGCSDPDGDQICDPDDNCPDDYNPLQEDYDGDGVGDACDPCSSLPPELALPDTLYYHTSQYFAFRPTVIDPDDSEHTIIYLSHPGWCQADGDSLYGTTTEAAALDTVIVEASDACSSDIDSLLILTYICGDVDKSGSLNMSDVVALINWIFGSSSIEIAVYAADVDCSDSINMSDIVYIINYIFGTFDPPCTGC